MALLAKNNEEGKEKILNEELDNLIKLKSELEQNNFKLRKTLKEHKLCPKIKSNLVNKLNMLNNSYEFEKKKTNMIETSLVNLEQKKESLERAITKNKIYIIFYGLIAGILFLIIVIYSSIKCFI